MTFLMFPYFVLLRVILLSWLFLVLRVAALLLNCLITFYYHSVLHAFLLRLNGH